MFEWSVLPLTKWRERVFPVFRRRKYAAEGLCVLSTQNSESALINHLIDQYSEYQMCVDIVCVFVCVSARWAQISWTNTWRNVIPDRNPHLWVTPPLITLLVFWQIVTHCVCAPVCRFITWRTLTLDQLTEMRHLIRYLTRYLWYWMFVCFNSSLCIRWVWANWAAHSWRLCWITWMLQPQVSPIHLIHLDWTPGASGADFFVCCRRAAVWRGRMYSLSLCPPRWAQQPKKWGLCPQTLEAAGNAKEDHLSIKSENLHRHNTNTPAARAGKVWTAAGVPRLLEKVVVFSHLSGLSSRLS